MLERTLSTKEAWKTQDTDELEIKINSLPDFFRYEPLHLKDWYYIEVHHICNANSYLGYVKNDNVAMPLLERFG